MGEDLVNQAVSPRGDTWLQDIVREKFISLETGINTLANEVKALKEQRIVEPAVPPTPTTIEPTVPSTPEQIFETWVTRKGRKLVVEKREVKQSKNTDKQLQDKNSSGTQE